MRGSERPVFRTFRPKRRPQGHPGLRGAGGTNATPTVKVLAQGHPAAAEAGRGGHPPRQARPTPPPGGEPQRCISTVEATDNLPGKKRPPRRCQGHPWEYRLSGVWPARVTPVPPAGCLQTEAARSAAPSRVTLSGGFGAHDHPLPPSPLPRGRRRRPPRRLYPPPQAPGGGSAAIPNLSRCPSASGAPRRPGDAPRRELLRFASKITTVGVPLWEFDSCVISSHQDRLGGTLRSGLVWPLSLWVTEGSQRTAVGRARRRVVSPRLPCLPCRACADVRGGYTPSGLGRRLLRRRPHA